MLKGVPSPICWIHEWRGRPGCRRHIDTIEHYLQMFNFQLQASALMPELVNKFRQKVQPMFSAKLSRNCSLYLLISLVKFLFCFVVLLSYGEIKLFINGLRSTL